MLLGGKLGERQSRSGCGSDKKDRKVSTAFCNGVPIACLPSSQSQLTGLSVLILAMPFWAGIYSRIAASSDDVGAFVSWDFSMSQKASCGNAFCLEELRIGLKFNDICCWSFVDRIITELRHVIKLFSASTTDYCAELCVQSSVFAQMSSPISISSPLQNTAFI